MVDAGLPVAAHSRRSQGSSGAGEIGGELGAASQFLGAEAIAPVVVLRYDDKSWQDLSGQIRRPSGLPADISAADKGVMAGRKDVVPVGQENLPRAVPGNTTFIVIGDAADAERFLADPTLQQTPSVEKQVIALGKDSFRLDYYSASNLIDRVTSAVR
ncbi:hypothetical protein ACFTWF_08360 [Rhodococcus sp. NPDC056960]|uniref:hypothetical protein n=1 Tax=Rhodococcus sp. NPDC056960 TaxID=3345982 RepID=UPI00363D8582